MLTQKAGPHLSELSDHLTSNFITTGLHPKIYAALKYLKCYTKLSFHCMFRLYKVGIGLSINIYDICNMKIIYSV